MAPRHAYPPDLASYVRAHWPAGRTLWLSQDLLGEALSIAYHASLTSEETRPTRMRLLLTSRDALPASGLPGEGALRLRFDRPRPFNVDELRQLAPSAPFESTLIGVDAAAGGKLQIWGLAHSGPAWLAPTWGGRGVVPNWTHDPIVHVTGPGLVTVRCAGKLVGALEQGRLVDAMMDVFDSEWLPAMFADVREEVRREHAASQATAASPTTVETSLIGRIGQQMLRRTIQLVLGARHGGLILVADVPAGATAHALPGLGFKYRFEDDEPARRYHTLLASVLHRLAAQTTNATVDWEDFVNDTDPELTRLEQSIFEMSRLIAGLTSIDGAVVLDKRFALLGFGAEVSGDAGTPARVWRALDQEGDRREANGVEEVGTRHRAAYRFVQQHPRGLALVISHDGGVSFVANRSDEVVFWQQSVSR